MKIVFEKEELLSVLTPAVTAVPGHALTGMTDGVLFECPGETAGTCRITSYDMEKGVRGDVAAAVEGEGRLVLNKQRILQIVRLMPEGEIVFDVDPSMKVRITAGLSSYEIMGIDGADFPGLPALSGDRSFRIPSDVLREIIAGTAVYTDPHGSRPAYTGILMKIRDGVMTAAGWDGSRMAIREAALSGDAPECDAIVPVRFLSELTRVLRDGGEAVEVSLGRKHIIFRTGGLIYFTRLISTEYPDYEKTLPGSYATEMFIRTDELRATLERAAVISEEKLGGFTRGIRLETEEGFVRVTAASSSGSIDERIPAEVRGDGGAVVLSCRYLLETVRVLSDIYAVRISMNDASGMIRMEEARGSGIVGGSVCGHVPEGFGRPDSDGDGEMRFVYLLMPRRR